MLTIRLSSPTTQYLLSRSSGASQILLKLEFSTHGQIYVYTQESPAGIQTPTHWNLICRCMSVPQHVLSPSSILPPPSSARFHCREEKFGSHLNNINISFLKLRNVKSCNMKLLWSWMWGSVMR